MVAALGLSACGGGSPSNADEAEANYTVDVTTARFPAEQRLGQTTLMELGFRNDGDEAVPSLAVTVTIAGAAGEDSTIPFSIRDPQPGLSQPDRPVWVLSEHYPKLNGSDKPGGTETASRKTFLLGALEPGESTTAVWKVTASRTGDYRVRYTVAGGLGGKAKAVAANGEPAVGVLPVKITEETPDLTVTDSGEVVEIDPKRAGN